MKKITLLLLLLIATTACLKRQDRHELRTAYGASVLYEGTTAALVYSELILLAVEMDIIAEASAEDSVKFADKFFPTFKFRSDGNKYCLVRDNEIYIEMTTDDQSLTTPNAKWTITKLYSNPFIATPVTIACVNSNCWTIQATRTTQATALDFSLELNSERKKLYDSPRDFNCLVSFDHASIMDPYRSVLHSLTTHSPLRLNYYRDQTDIEYIHYPLYDWCEITKGVIVDNFLNPVNGKMEVVEAEFIPSQDQYYAPETKIKYGGFTDSWYWNNIQDYHAHYYFR